MVSIPDWSRFRRGPPPPPSPLGSKRLMTPRERYMRAMEKEAINEASRKGYFLEPAKEKIIEDFGETHGAEDPRTGLPMQKQMWHVNHIRYTHQHMKLLGDIGLFTRITILVLDHNYLDSIDSLASCRELIKLDIHSNQISVLPDGVFWAELQKLRILIAHDNPIARVEVIHSLAACGRLQILTLYDSPLSLKKNYRHHIVNTLWSLKALDHHVVSDEEIIEDAVFKSTRFAAMNKVFEVDLSPPYPKPGATFETELISIRNVIKRVNKIMAHFCPVLIIQKNIRFWLTYRRYRLYQESRIWAAITIQTAWRKYKNLPEPNLDSNDLDKLLAPGFSTYMSAPPTPAKHAKRSSVQLASKESSTIYARTRQTSHVRVGDRELMSSAGSMRRAKVKKGLVIDFQRLIQMSHDREDSLNTALVLARAHKMAPKKNQGKVPGTRTIPAPPQPPGRRQILHQSYYFGPIVTDPEHEPTNHRNCLPPTLPETDIEYTYDSLPLISSGYRTVDHPLPAEIILRAIENNEELPRIPYRLIGQKHDIHQVDKFEDLMLTKKEQGQDIRDAELSGHDTIANRPPQNRVKKAANVKEKFLFDRMQNTMALSALVAVQQAYQDRDADEKKAARMRATYEMKERREVAKERVKAYKEDRKLLVLASRQEDQKKIKDSLEDKQIQTQEELKKSIANRQRVKGHQLDRSLERKFAVEFRTQQTSVSKALLKHDRQVATDAKIQRKIEKVEALKDIEREQQEIVKKYLQHRQMMRQSENAMARAALDTRMLQDANDRVFEAKSRIEQKKTRQSQAKQYASLPPTAIEAPSLDRNTPLAEAIRNNRYRHSKSMYQFHLPSTSHDHLRPETRLTLSGGLIRPQEQFY